MIAPPVPPTPDRFWLVFASSRPAPVGLLQRCPFGEGAFDAFAVVPDGSEVPPVGEQLGTFVSIEAAGDFLIARAVAGDRTFDHIEEFAGSGP